MKTVPLASVARIESGAGFPLVHQGKHEEEFPFLKVSDMNLPGNERRIQHWNNCVSDAVRHQLRAKAFPAGSLIFPKIGAAIGTNKKRQLTRPSCVDNNVMAVIPQLELIDPDYLYFAFLAKNISDFASASNPPSIRKPDVENWCLPVPTLHEQRRIVDLLTRAESIVRLRREAAAKAAELIPAIFIDMFGDPVRNPKAWPIVPLGSVATVQGGLQVTRARLSHPLERPYLRVANVYRDRLDLVEIKSIRLTEAELNRTRLQIGDLLFVEGHGNPQEVGRVAVWDGSIQDCTHQNHLIRARPNNDQLMPEFACVQLNTPAGRQSLLRAGKTTSGLSTISAQNVKDAEVMLPRMALQRDFVKLAEEAQSIATLQTEAQLKAQATFNALLAQAFAPHGSL